MNWVQPTTRDTPAGVFTIARARTEPGRIEATASLGQTLAARGYRFTGIRLGLESAHAGRAATLACSNSHGLNTDRTLIGNSIPITKTRKNEKTKEVGL